METKSPSTRARKPTRPTPKPRAPKIPVGAKGVDPHAVTLLRTKGGAKTGGGPGGEAWQITVEGKSAGRVFINKIDEPPFGPHASIQIFLNVDSQGRGIGRLGYRRACETSAYDTIYAHMRKSNIASGRAAEAAGFVDATPAGAAQKVMVWRRGKS